MPLSANTANVVTLAETAQDLRVSMWLYQVTAGDESDVLKINVATLSYRTLTFNANTNTALMPTGPMQFVAGEQVIGGTSGAVAYVRDWNATTGKLVVTAVSNGTFSGTEVVTGQYYGKSITLTSITTPTYVLELNSIWFSISAGASVGLQWGNTTPSYATFAMLAGTGYRTKQSLTSMSMNPTNSSALVNPNGNLYISTYGIPNKGTYWIEALFKKTQGFSGIPQLS